MGLDMVEFVLSVEEAFDLRIPDDVAGFLTTPRQVIDYLHGQLPQSTERTCVSQRAFYALRREVCERVGTPEARLRPTTPLADILPPAGDRGRTWAGVGNALDVRNWPRAGPGRWPRSLGGPRVQTLGEAARYASVRMGFRLKRPGEGWTWEEVAAVVDRLMREELPIDDYSLDDEFIKDLGLD
jgi:acyl carrier protein